MITRALALAVEGLTRAHAAAWVLSGNPVIYGAHLNGPLKIASAENMLISHCRITDGGIEIMPAFVPAEWSQP